MGGSVNETLLENALNNRLTGGNGHNIVLGLADRKKATYYLSGRIGLPRGRRENSSRSSAAVFLAPSITEWHATSTAVAKRLECGFCFHTGDMASLY